VLRVLLEPVGELLAHEVLDRRAHLGGDQLVLGLGGELGIGNLDRQDAGEALARVVASEVHLLPLGDAGVLGVFRDGARQRRPEPLEVRAAVALGDVVGEGQDRLVVGVVPPHRDLDTDAVALSRDVDGVGQGRGLRAVEVFHEFLDATLVEELGALELGPAVVLKGDLHARVEEGELAQTVLERLEAVVEVREGPVGAVRLGRGEEAHLRPLLAGRVAHDVEGMAVSPFSKRA
jgi:hypothetical protein